MKSFPLTKLSAVRQSRVHQGALQFSELMGLRNLLFLHIFFVNFNTRYLKKY